MQVQHIILIHVSAPKFHTTLIQIYFIVYGKGHEINTLKTKEMRIYVSLTSHYSPKSGKFVMENPPSFSGCVFKPSCMRQLAHLPYFLYETIMFQLPFAFFFYLLHWASKKLISSSERHTLKSTTSKWIIYGQWWAIVLLMKHICKMKGLLLSKRRKKLWNWRKKTYE